MVREKYYQKVKKDYQQKNLRNPFFHHKQAGKSRHGSKYLVIIGLAVIIGLVWFFLASPVWRLQTVSVVGLTRGDKSGLENIIWNQAQEKTWLFFRGNNIFLFDKEAALEKIGADYNFSGGEITSDWPRTLILTVKERPYGFVFQEGEKLSYASIDGYLINEPPVAEEDKAKYFILENGVAELSLINTDGRLNITADYLNFTIDLANQLSQSGLTLEKFIIDQEFNTLKAKIKDGPLVYFSIKDKAANQLDRLLLVKNEKIKDNFSKTNYIDLRYGEKVFINPEFK